MSRQWNIFLLVLTLCLPVGAVPALSPVQPDTLTFPPRQAKFVRFLIHATSAGQPCIDELEVYGPDSLTNLALAAHGAKAAVSSSLAGYSIHQAAQLNDGLYGNDHSWVAASSSDEWVQIELTEAAKVSKVVFSRDRTGRFKDRIPVAYEVQLSVDGKEWAKVTEVKTLAKPVAKAPVVPTVPLAEPVTWDGLLRYAFLCEKGTWSRMNATDHLSPLKTDRGYWSRLATLGPVARTLLQMEDLIVRLEEKGVDVAAEKTELEALRQRGDDEATYLDARLAKRRLMFRDPDLAPLQQVLFVKRHPYLSSHNYSDILDSRFTPGGGICVLEIPRRNGQLDPKAAKLVTLFDGSTGIARPSHQGFWRRRSSTNSDDNVICENRNSLLIIQLHMTATSRTDSSGRIYTNLQVNARRNWAHRLRLPAYGQVLARPFCLSCDGLRPGGCQ